MPSGHIRRLSLPAIRRSGLRDGLLAGHMFFLAGEDRQQIVQRVAVPQPVKADIVAPALRADGDGFSTPVNGKAVLLQQAQQLLQAGRFLCQRPVNSLAQLLFVGGLCRIAQPLVVALAAPLWSLHNGVAVFDADGIAQTVDSAGAAPKVAELAVTLQRGGVPYNMVVDVSLVNVGADDESVLVLGKSPGQLYAQPVGFLRRDLARHKGLPQVVGNHIVRTAHPAGAGGVGLLVQQELRIGHAAVTLVAGDEPAVVGLFWIFYIVDDVADRLADRAALAGVQRYNAGGGHVGSASFPKNKRPAHHRPHRFTLYQFPRPYKNRNLPQSHLPIHPVLSWAGTEFHIVPSPGFARHPACPSSVSSATKVVLWIIAREG